MFLFIILKRLFIIKFIEIYYKCEYENNILVKTIINER